MIDTAEREIARNPAAAAIWAAALADWKAALAELLAGGAGTVGSGLTGGGVLVAAGTGVAVGTLIQEPVNNAVHDAFVGFWDWWYR